MDYLALACRVLVGVTFLAAVLGKVRDLDAFRSFTVSLRALGWLPARLRRWVATITVGTELSIVALVAWSPTAPAGLAVAAAAVGAFTAAMVDASRQGRPVRCRCLGGGEVWGRAHVVRNVLLGGAALLGLLAQATAARPQPAGAIVAAGVAVVAALLLIHSHDLAYLLSSDRR